MPPRFEAFTFQIKFEAFKLQIKVEAFTLQIIFAGSSPLPIFTAKNHFWAKQQQDFK